MLEEIAGHRKKDCFRTFLINFFYEKLLFEVSDSFLNKLIPFFRHNLMICLHRCKYPASDFQKN